MDENGTNSARTEARGTSGGGRRPFIFGAIAGAVIAALVAVVLVLALSDDDSSSSSASSTSTSSSSSVPPTTTSPPPTSTAAPTTTRPPNLPPPSIPSWGVQVDNCPQGASSTTVHVSYSARNAEEIQFAIDDDVVQSSTDLEGSADVGPFPCDGEQHTLTGIAISDGLRGTRNATIAVSSNSTIVHS
jgi:hypothetical protein